MKSNLLLLTLSLVITSTASASDYCNQSTGCNAANVGLVGGVTVGAAHTINQSHAEVKLKRYETFHGGALVEHTRSQRPMEIGANDEITVKFKTPAQKIIEKRVADIYAENAKLERAIKALRQLEVQSMESLRKVKYSNSKQYTEEIVMIRRKINANYRRVEDLALEALTTDRPTPKVITIGDARNAAEARKKFDKEMKVFEAQGLDPIDYKVDRGQVRTLEKQVNKHRARVRGSAVFIVGMVAAGSIARAADTYVSDQKIKARSASR